MTFLRPEMKILFIYPNVDSQPGFNYGLAHMAAVLKEHGHQVELWHLCEALASLPGKEQFQAQVVSLQPDIIGFSVVTNQWAYARELAQWSREITDSPIVCGGVHVLAEPKNVLESGLFDYIFRGEAEEAFLEFVQKMASRQPVDEVKNLGCIINGDIRLNPIRPLPDLNALPPKDYQVFDFQRLIDVKNGWVGLMSSRGCPFACTYCFNHQMVEHYRKDLNCSFKELNYIRHFDPDKVLSEIQYLLSHYSNIKMFILDDDLFTYEKDYVIAFCRGYKKLTQVPFVVNAHVNFFDADRARHLADANCQIVKFGVESGSRRVRKEVLNRHMSNERIQEAIGLAKAYGLHASVFLMIGLPGESREELMSTITLMAGSLPGRYRWSFFYPFPGTKAYEITVQMGCLDESRMDSLSNFTEASCLDFGEEHNLFLEKVGKIMPWFVNACSDLPVAEFYRKKVQEIEAMDREAWTMRKSTLLEEDREISGRFAAQGLSHYAVKYNPFMGVISDYFLQEG